MDEALIRNQNPLIMSYNKEKAHVISMPYSTLEQVKNNEPSPWMRSLNGPWKFNFSHNSESKPSQFYLQNQDVGAWADIEVPGLWQLQGYNQQDPPYFLSQDYPPAIGKKNIPSIDPLNNSVGSYKRIFIIPDEWQEREIFICFNGVKSSFNLWINGTKIGCSQGAATPAEFNISQYILFGEENAVSVEVYRFCEGTYLEGFNTWFLSGIYRDVFIYAEPKIYLQDYFVSCQFDSCYEDATLKIKVEVVNKTAHPEPILLEVYLSEQADSVDSDYFCDCRFVAKGERTTSIAMETIAKMPKKWYAEAPKLYFGAFVLRDINGQEIGVKKFTYGFRTVDIKKGTLLVNGVPVLLKGINRLDFDSVTGCAISKKSYEEDLQLLKKCNVNAIRTGQYPNDTCFYELCDQYGFYVMNEAGVLIHPLGKKENISNRPAWRDAMVDRMSRMVTRDRNHPCVIIWALGNSAQRGENFMEMKKEAVKLDDTRPFYCDGDIEFRTSDFLSAKSGSIEWIDAVGQHQILDKKLLNQSYEKKSFYIKKVNNMDYQDKPALLCGYDKRSDNGLSDLKIVMEKFEKYENWCGGFLEDLADAEKGNLNALTHEVKKIYQNFTIKEMALEPYNIEITQKSFFVDENHYYILWELLEDGEIHLKGEQDLGTFEESPSQIITLPIDAFEKQEGVEYHLNVSMRLKQPTLWADKDHVVAWEQIKISNHKNPIIRNVSDKELVIHDRKIKIEINGDGFAFRISKLTGDITSLIYDKKEYLVSPLKLNFYEAMINEDFPTSQINKLLPKVNWKKASETYSVQKVVIDNLKTEVLIQVMRKVKHIKNSLVTEYVIDGEGNLFVSHQLTPKKNLLKFGTSLDISDEFSTLSWFGNGHQEKHAGTKIGVYSCHIQDYAHQYLKSQENSNRSDIRWFSATTEQGEGLHFEDTEGTLLNMSAWPYKTKELDEARYENTFRTKNTITLNIDYKQKGIGTEKDSLVRLGKEHRLLKNVEYKYGYKICRAY